MRTPQGPGDATGCVVTCRHERGFEAGAASADDIDEWYVEDSSGEVAISAEAGRAESGCARRTLGQQ